MQKKIIIAPVNAGSDLKLLFSPIREFPVERVMLLTSPDGIVKAENFRKELQKLTIPASIVRVKPSSNPWEDYFVILSDVVEGQEKEQLLINVSTADRISQCALTNAAHVNGIRAVAIINGNVMVLPVLKLSYSAVLSPKKLGILKVLEKECSSSLEELAKKTGMSLQLLSYHIKGTEKSPGLVQLELAETREAKGRTSVCLSTMGRLFMRGYIS